MRALLLAAALAVACHYESAAIAAPGAPTMKLDDLLAHAASADFTKYDPRAVIDAVNALIPLGKDAALDKIAHAKGDRGLFLVLRVLFDADPPPPMRIGAPVPPPPAKALPSFPILMVDDVPLMLARGYTLAGLPEAVSSHVDYYRAHGTLRAAPLKPPAKLDRATVEAAYRAVYGAAPDDQERAHLNAQLDRAKL
ncbi:MAG TPA: hypothetical protein VGM88_16660 [Kofleriaceae bacterium]|jgi:hypothetical protein